MNTEAIVQELVSRPQDEVTQAIAKMCALGVLDMDSLGLTVKSQVDGLYKDKIALGFAAIDLLLDCCRDRKGNASVLKMLELLNTFMPGMQGINRRFGYTE